MTTVFVAGSMNIRRLDKKVTERIDNIINSGFAIVVGDADGVDASIQTYLFQRGASNTTVFCSGDAPRNNIGEWAVRNVKTDSPPGSRAYFTAKDLAMAQVADFGLMIWDARSTGTLSNVIELLSRDKKCVVFVNKRKEFKTVGALDQLVALVGCMSDTAKQKAETKIRLSSRLSALKYKQTQIFA